MKTPSAQRKGRAARATPPAPPSRTDLSADRRELAAFMRRLYRQRLTTTSGGNLSVRVDADSILLTASKHDKARLTAGQVCVLRLDGTNLTPGLTPSIEAGMHLAIYCRHPHVRAIVHAHPATATAFCAAREPINCRLIAEAYAVVGTPVWADYACMGSEGLAEAVAETAGRGPCVLMANHGILTTGATLLEAFDRLEVLEIAAQTTLIVRQLGGGRSLDDDRLAELDRLMGRNRRA